jgi:hypothetical protein
MSNNTAVVATPHSVTLANGTVINSNMTPTERHNAVAKSMGVAPAERPAPPVFGPKGMTDGTAAEYLRRDAQAAKAPPPSQAGAKAPPPSVVVPPQGTPAERATNPAAFTPPAPPPTGKVIVDERAIDALNKIWRAMTPEQREAQRATYEHDLKTIFERRRLGETVAQFEAFEAHKAGTPAQTHTPAEWEKGHASVTDKDGWIPLTRVNAKGLSGYVLPKLIEGQQYHKSIFSELANARAAGVSQEVVTNYITAQMKRDGFIK